MKKILLILLLLNYNLLFCAARRIPSGPAVPAKTTTSSSSSSSSSSQAVETPKKEYFIDPIYRSLGFTPLMAAISHTPTADPHVNLRLFEEALKNTEDVNAVNRAGQTALNIASQLGQTDMVKRLLELPGIKINSYDIINAGNVDILKLLFSKHPVTKDLLNYTLLQAATLGNLAQVQFLLNEGADINIKGEYGHTPLSSASVADNAEIVKTLITRGADVNARNYWGTPLHLARERLPINEKLLKDAADNPTLADYYKRKLNNTKEIIRLLTQAGGV